MKYWYIMYMYILSYIYDWILTITLYNSWYRDYYYHIRKWCPDKHITKQHTFSKRWTCQMQVHICILLLPVSPRLIYLFQCLNFFISTPVLVVFLLSLSVCCWLCLLWFFCNFLIFLPFLILLDLFF